MDIERGGFLSTIERLAQQTLDDIEEVLPAVRTLVGAIDYEVRRPFALFEPLDAERFTVAEGFLGGERAHVIWHRQSSYAVRPDGEAFAVALALLALTEEGLLRLVDAIPVFTRWRDGLFLR